MKNTFFLAAAFAIGCMQCAQAQDTLNSVSVKPIEDGKILSSYATALTGTFYGVAVGYQHSLAHSPSEWARALHVQDIAYEANYLNFHHVSLAHVPGSGGQLGSAYGFSVRLDMLLFSIASARVILSPGIGAEYMTQTFYTDGNMIIGSHLNLAVQAGLKVQAPMSRFTSIQFELNATHLSNASTRLPNNGLNLGTVSLALIQDIDAPVGSAKKSAFTMNDGGAFELGVTFGTRGKIKTGYFLGTKAEAGYYDTTGRKKLRSDLYQTHASLGYRYPLVRRVLSLGIGTDVTYYSKLFTYGDFLGTYQGSSSSYSHFSAGINANAQLWLGRMAVMAGYGRFVYSKFLEPQTTYWTCGLKYYVSPCVALNANAFMHGGEPTAGFGIVLAVR